MRGHLPPENFRIDKKATRATFKEVRNVTHFELGVINSPLKSPLSLLSGRLNMWPVVPCLSSITLCIRRRFMKSVTEYLTFNIPERMGFLNITSRLEEILRGSGIQEGLMLCNAMHITASVFINDDESGLHADYRKWLEQLAPFDASPQRYAHNRTGEDNADAHMKRQIMGREVVIAVTQGRLDFGPWEQVFYGEFDGRRSKKVLVKIIGE